MSGEYKQTKPKQHNVLIVVVEVVAVAGVVVIVVYETRNVQLITRKMLLSHFDSQFRSLATITGRIQMKHRNITNGAADKKQHEKRG